MRRRSFLRGLLALVAAPIAIAKVAVAAVSKPRCARYVWAPYIPMYTTPPILTGFKGSDFVKSFQQLGFVTLKDGDIDQKTVVTLHKWRDNCLAKGVTS